jgi:hypothetical protein
MLQNTNVNIGWFSKKTNWLLILFLIVVVSRILLAMPMYQPLIVADEIGYLGNARYIAGTAPLPDLRGCAFYHFGYSLLLLPAFWFFADPLHAYKAVLVINALLSGATFIVLYRLLNDIAGYSASNSRVAAFVTTCYPALLFFPNLAMAENVFFPAFLSLLIFAGRLVVTRSWTVVFVFGTLAGFLYTIHARGLPITLLAVLFLILLAKMRVLECQKSFTGATVALTVVGLSLAVNHQLKLNGWGGHDGNTMPIPGTFTILEYLKSLLCESAGQLLYLLLATYGLFLIGVWEVIISFKTAYSDGIRTVLADKKYASYMFLGGAVAATLCISIYFMGRPLFVAGRGDIYFYGRYNEVIAIPIIALALARVLETSAEWRATFRGLGVIIVIVLCMAAIVIVGRGWQQMQSLQVMSLNILGLAPYVNVLGDFNIAVVCFIGVIISAIIALLRHWNCLRAIMILALLFAVAGGVNYATILISDQRYRQNEMQMIKVLEQNCNTSNIGYDFSYFNPVIFYSYQYRLPHITFIPFISDQLQISRYFEPFARQWSTVPNVRYLISGRNWQDQFCAKSTVVMSEESIDNSLWFRPCY